MEWGLRNPGLKSDTRYTHLVEGRGGGAPCGRGRVAPDFNPGLESPHQFPSPFRGDGANEGA